MSKYLQAPQSSIYIQPPPFLLPPSPYLNILSFPPQILSQPSRQLRIMPPRLRTMRRALPVRTAHLTSDWWPPGQIGAAVAAVEGEFDR